MLEYDYVKFDKFVPDHVCDTLINVFGDWKQGKVQSEFDQNDIKKIRDCEISWISNHFWLSSFYKIMIDANVSSGLNFNIKGVENMQLTRYDAPSGHYDFHMDGNGYFSTRDDGLVRKLSMTCLLNDPKDFEGGNFTFRASNDEYSVDLNKGDVIIFPSYLLHKVSQVTKGSRCSLVVWALGEPFR